jgi:hypothetical protein
MATKILLKKSVTGGSSPLTSDLDQGELAVNLVDRKIYTKDAGNNITRLDGAYVDSVAPANPVEGDIWYDTANNLLKAYDGSAWQSAGYQNLADLEDVTLTTITTGDHLTWNGTAFVNSNLESDVEDFFSAANTGTGYGTLSYAAGEFSFAKVTDAEIRAAVSAVDAGGDGSFAYDSATGEFTFTGPSQAEVLAHISGGTGISVSAGGEIALDFADAGFKTDNVVEGSTNLYYTDERVDDRVAALIVGGTNLTATYDDAANTLTIDAVVGGSGYDLSVNDTDDLAEGTNNKYFSDTLARAAISVTDAGGSGSLAYNPTSGVITYTGPDSSEVRTEISAVDNGGDGSLSYDNTTGVISYTGPSASEVQAHITGGTGVTVTAGEVAIGQAVATTDDVTFASVETNTLEHTGTITINPNSGGAANEGTVVIAGNLTVEGTQTAVNSNEVNIGDAVILLNANETGAASLPAGIEIERGTDANVSFLWNEAEDAWDLADETLQNVCIDGGTY